MNRDMDDFQSNPQVIQKSCKKNISSNIQSSQPGQVPHKKGI